MTIPTPHEVVYDALAEKAYWEDITTTVRTADVLDALADNGYSLIRTSVLETLTIPRLPAAAVQRARTTDDMIADDMYAQQGFH